MTLLGAVRDLIRLVHARVRQGVQNIRLALAVFCYRKKQKWSLVKVLAFYANGEIHHFPVHPFSENSVLWNELTDDIQKIEFRYRFNGAKYRRIVRRHASLEFPPSTEASKRFCPAVVHAALCSTARHFPPKSCTHRIQKYAGPRRDFWGEFPTDPSDFFPWDDYSSAYDQLLLFDSWGRKHSLPFNFT